MPYLKSPVYTVYMYIAPDGRRYIGKTGLQRGARAQNQGAGYKHCRKFWNAIQRYGWNTFVYRVLATIPKSEPNAAQKACDLETEFIQKYQTTNTRFGFNTYTTDKPRSYARLAEIHRNRRVVNKDGIIKKVPGTEFEGYIRKGWKPGYKCSS